MGFGGVGVKTLWLRVGMEFVGLTCLALWLGTDSLWFSVACGATFHHALLGCVATIYAYRQGTTQALVDKSVVDLIVRGTRPAYTPPSVGVLTRVMASAWGSGREEETE